MKKTIKNFILGLMIVGLISVFSSIKPPKVEGNGVITTINF